MYRGMHAHFDSIKLTITCSVCFDALIGWTISSKPRFWSEQCICPSHSTFAILTFCRHLSKLPSLHILTARTSINKAINQNHRYQYVWSPIFPTFIQACFQWIDKYTTIIFVSTDKWTWLFPLCKCRKRNGIVVFNVVIAVVVVVVSLILQYTA